MKRVGAFLALGLLLCGFARVPAPNSKPTETVEPTTVTPEPPIDFSLKMEAVSLFSLASNPNFNPAKVNENFIKSHFNPEMIAAFRKTAIEWEILDPREMDPNDAKEGFFNSEADFVEDLATLQERFKDLKNAPPVSDALLLPDRDGINKGLDFNRAYQANLRNQLLMNRDRAEFYEEALKESKQLLEFWTAVRDAKADYNMIADRRYALKKMKEMLGDEDYYSKNFPPMVPLWRFREIN